MTRLNVYAGPAGFLIRGGPAGDKDGSRQSDGNEAILPGPAPKEGDRFPSNKTYFEIDRGPGSSVQQRRLALLPGQPQVLRRGHRRGPGFIPDTDLSPMEPEFFGNMIMVNGNTWPFLDVQRRRYRLRFLNGCQSRFLILDFGDIPGVEVWQIGNEGGFLAAPVSLTADRQNRLLMGLAERADLIVDFTNVPQGRHPRQRRSGRAVRRRRAGLEPRRVRHRRPRRSGRIVAFDVGPALAPDPTTPPRFLVLPALKPLPRRRGSARSPSSR